MMRPIAAMAPMRAGKANPLNNNKLITETCAANLQSIVGHGYELKKPSLTKFKNGNAQKSAGTINDSKANIETTIVAIKPN